MPEWAGTALHGLKSDRQRSQRRVLKTSQDYHDMLHWTAERANQRAAGSRAVSGRPGLVSIFLKAATRQELDLPPLSHHEVAKFVGDIGWPVTEDIVKKAKSRGAYSLGLVHHLSPEEERLVYAVFYAHPRCGFDQLTAQGSPAEARMAELGMQALKDYHRNRMQMRMCELALALASRGFNDRVDDRFGLIRLSPEQRQDSKLRCSNPN